MTVARISRIAPVLTVSNGTMKPMRDFFVEKLGFAVGIEMGNGPAFITLDRNGLTVMLECKPMLFGPKKSWAIYLWVNDIEAMYADLLSRGTTLKDGVVDKDYGCREVVAIAPDGRQVVFGQLQSET